MIIRYSRRTTLRRFDALRYHSVRLRSDASKDPRIDEASGGNVLTDKFASLRDQYEAPKNPIILAHGLLGFDELRLAGPALPAIQYWFGIREALAAKGVTVHTAAVMPTSSIEQRAEELARQIEAKAQGQSVNVIAHSMGGLDSRYMISRLKPRNVKVLSLTTIASPHRGSAFADFMFSRIGMTNIPRLYRALEFFGLETGAFRQLTIKYMNETFNPATPDVDGVRYFSYGAALQPRWTSIFRKSHSVISKVEGENDGLVSVESSRWGTYKGTLDNVSHLDLINWTNRLRWYIWELTGHKRSFNAIAFYLDIADMLAKEGL